MHSAQRRAVLAILTMIESGMREIRAVLSDGTVHTDDGHRVVPPPPPQQPVGTLSDDEEETLEKMMEKHRMDLLRSTSTTLERFYDDAAPMFEEAPE